MPWLFPQRKAHVRLEDQGPVDAIVRLLRSEMNKPAARRSRWPGVSAQARNGEFAADAAKPGAAPAPDHGNPAGIAPARDPRHFPDTSGEGESGAVRLGKRD